MGQASSSGTSRRTNYLSVEETQLELKSCKASLGLELEDPYPKEYDGRCDGAEFELKKAICFLLDSRSARILYDTAAARSERQAANKALQPKLKKYRWVPPP